MYMLFDKAVAFAKGTVCFSARDGFFGVFIAKCRKNNVPIYNAVVRDGVFFAKTNVRSLSLLDKAADEAGVSLSIEKQYGLPVVLSKLKRRYGVPAGLIIALVLFLYFSSVIWSVEINGADKSNIYNVRRTAEACGLKRGAPVRNINKEEIEDRLNTLSPFVQRASVNIIGNRAYIEIYERDVVEPKKNGFLYSDIVAAKDGEIIKADVFQGKSMMNDNGTVKKGDVLVTGAVTMKNEDVRYTESLARIIALTTNEFSVSTAKTIYANSLTETINSYSICFFGLTLPVTQSAHGEAEVENEYLLNTSDAVFPVGLLKTTTMFITKKDIFLSDAAAFLMSANDLAVNIHDNYKARNIKDLRESVKYADAVVIEAVVTCQEDICESKYKNTPIEAEKQTE